MKYPAWFVCCFFGSSNGGNWDFLEFSLPFSASKKGAEPWRCLSLSKFGKYFNGNTPFHVYICHVFSWNSQDVSTPRTQMTYQIPSIIINAFIDHYLVLLPSVHWFNQVLAQYHLIMRFNIVLGKRLLCMMHMCLTKMSFFVVEFWDEKWKTCCIQA